MAKRLKPSESIHSQPARPPTLAVVDPYDVHKVFGAVKGAGVDIMGALTTYYHCGGNNGS